jgi:hypothetical protein
VKANSLPPNFNGIAIDYGRATYDFVMLIGSDFVKITLGPTGGTLSLACVVVRQPLPTIGLPSPKMYSSKMRLRTWAHELCAMSLFRPTTR